MMYKRYRTISIWIHKSAKNEPILYNKCSKRIENIRILFSYSTKMKAFIKRERKNICNKIIQSILILFFLHLSNSFVFIYILKLIYVQCHILGFVSCNKRYKDAHTLFSHWRDVCACVWWLSKYYRISWV